ncbi:methionine--tRNA ligase, chloroplastic mitochondrial [Olea europaea subsp. europaea]|uniref:Methionine--tRNA ligase, chloroplastic mitochondrial n=1 Tax=Olea europaea subsp. europaea TaxID=158383 RepID=A0A8S0SHC6_OLEEU|nr:methionine--tRNA ligase, chloroplastic mitochondrial [Olea europaea subsp. europaea]
MACRVQHSMQNSLWFLSSSRFYSTIQSQNVRSKNPKYFCKKLLSSSSFSKGVRHCSATASYTDANINHSNAESFVLTTPLYYVNAPPHMGSAYTTIAADAIARFQRLLRKKVIFITGTDEHGEKIAGAAAANGSSPREHCDSVSQAYKLLWRDLDIAYDKFIRTTDSKHEALVKEFYSKVLANGDIYRADYEGLYCVNCEEYKVMSNV